MRIIYIILAMLLGSFAVPGALANLSSIIGFDITFTVKCLIARLIKSPLILLLSILLSVVLHGAVIVVCSYLAYRFEVLTYLVSATVVFFFYFYIYNRLFFTKKYLLSAYLRKHIPCMDPSLSWAVCFDESGQISNYEDVAELVTVSYQIYSGK